MADSPPASASRRPSWKFGASLALRIMAVNVIALGLLAGSVFYIDSYRNQIMAERFALAASEAAITAAALAPASTSRKRKLIAAIGTSQKLRLRLYGPDGQLVADSFALAEPSFTFSDPATEPWLLHAARALDRGMDVILGSREIEPYAEPADTTASAWPEITEARQSGGIAMRQRLAPDRTPVISAAAAVGEKGEILLTTRNSPDITQKVRDARQTLAIIIGMALVVSILLSLFLARTIVRPLRLLVRAAVRVRLGRDRTVVVPRLPDRGDEIGMLARAVSDMTTALRQRIDGVESFAADVAHEIKNPLASLRSAIETLAKVEDPELRQQLTRIAAHDVRRIDRLVTEISYASRIDAELSRTTFEALDLYRLISALVTERDDRGVNGDCGVRVLRSGEGSARVAGDAPRLQRAIENLLDNAVSFSPAGAQVEVEVSCREGRVLVMVCDHGPGIAPAEREKVFERFHSLRPPGESFGSHSGLGLAIARTIVEAHDGTLTAQARRDDATGACLVIDLPAVETP